jgi:tetratricopeptide (TPR) repeat protein
MILDVDYAELILSFSDTCLQTGDLPEALKYIEDGNKIAQQMKSQYQPVFLERLGTIYALLGDTGKALHYFKQEWYISEKLCEASPGNTSFKNGLAGTYAKIGEIYEAAEPAKALGYYAESIKLHETLCKDFPGDKQYMDPLATSYFKPGELYAGLQQWEQALPYFEKSFVISKALFDEEPANADYKDGLAKVYQYLGRVAATGMVPEDMAHYYNEYHRLRTELANDYPENAGYINGLAISFSRLGEMQAEPNAALTFFSEYHRLEQMLCRAHPGSIEYKNGLAIACLKMAETEGLLGHADNALFYFDESIGQAEELYTTYPVNPAFADGVALTHWKKGYFYLNANEVLQARTCFEKARQLWSELVSAFPAIDKFKTDLSDVISVLSAF